MSLYNHMMDGFSESLPIAAFLLKLPDPTKFQVLFPRFRDTHVTQDPNDHLSFTVTVMTRTGGDNRKEYSGVIGALREHLDFVSERDCNGDSTFMYFVFHCQLPEDFGHLGREIGDKMSELGLHNEGLPMDRYLALNALMQSSPDDPRVVAAMERGAAMMKPLMEKATKEGANLLEIKPVPIPGGTPDSTLN